MAVPILLEGFSRSSIVRHEMDVVLQSRTSQCGVGRFYTKAAPSHGCIKFVLLTPLQNGRITTLYAKGLSTREVVAAFKEMYDADVSTTLVSKVTERVLEQITVW